MLIVPSPFFFFCLNPLIFLYFYSVLIFEVTEPGFPEEEAVRIFVQFSTQEAATAALTEMHGRFFGGRSVRGNYFSEERFEAADLAPRSGEVGL